MNEEQLRQLIITVLNALNGGPAPLDQFLQIPWPGMQPVTQQDLRRCHDLLLSADPNEPVRLRFGDLLRQWDNALNGAWNADTRRNTTPRRQLIYQLLAVDADMIARIEALLPFCRIEEPVVVHDETADWYNPEQYGPNSPRTFYWRAYSRYLRDKGWTPESILGLDNSTREIVSRLGNPEDMQSTFAARGLVMGYVQSGKTANFTGVIAKAVDAGYRLVIVLAGTWNMLRTQTQRRLDKELIGREQLAATGDYNVPPVDWNDFVSHGGRPSQMGTGFDCNRLTGLADDYEGLDGGLGALDFAPMNPALPFNHGDNLHRAPFRIIVIKKLPRNLKALNDDLTRIRENLMNVPALIIDDESDQAGLNTKKPRRNLTVAERRERTDITKTNRQIRRLLRLLPRGQYVGYTATPFANFLVDPSDTMDLFPRHFIIPLDRPSGYMGVADFFDTEVPSDELDPDNFTQRERAFVRDAHDSDDAAYEGSMRAALASYVLSGAIKLYRQDHAEPPAEGARRPVFPHHTMLVHTSHQNTEQEEDRNRVTAAFNQLLNTPGFGGYFQALWNDDFLPVITAQNLFPGLQGYVPASFREIRPYIDRALRKIQTHPMIRVLNSTRESDQAPDFDREGIWEILIGGNKLSRGYTVEGLTVSYYLRKAGASDTLMQMGRWFGFRPGYKDLVRIFIGRNLGPGGVDLIEDFKDACRLEEKARNDIRRYSRENAEGGRPLRPIDIAPLIEISGRIPPTSRVRMWNAQVVSTNFGDQWYMPVQMPVRQGQQEHNLGLAATLWNNAADLGELCLGGRYQVDGYRDWPAKVRETTVSDFMAFLSGFEWLRGASPNEKNLHLNFLRDPNNGINSCLIVAPQLARRPVEGREWIGDMTVKRRRRLLGGAFQGFGEPLHRGAADFMTGRPARMSEPTANPLEDPTPDTAELRDDHRMIVLLYPVLPEGETTITMGFEVLYPDNDADRGIYIQTRIHGDVPAIRDPDAPAADGAAAGDGNGGDPHGIPAGDDHRPAVGWLRLRYSKTLYAGVGQHVSGMIAEVSGGQVAQHAFSAAGGAVEERVELKAPKGDRQAAARWRVRMKKRGTLVERLARTPDAFKLELEESSFTITPGDGNEVHVLLTSGGGGEEERVLLDWTGDAMRISGDLLEEIDALMGVETEESEEAEEE
jgi:hypothetical protein